MPSFRLSFCLESETTKEEEEAKRRRDERPKYAMGWVLSEVVATTLRSPFGTPCWLFQRVCIATKRNAKCKMK